jgi:pilus assembly protein CpaB
VSARRTLILVAAVVLAAVAAVAVFLWLRGVEDRAYEDARLVKVFRVAKDIPKGTAGEQALTEEMIQSDEAPQEYRPATAITNTDVIRGKVALSNLSTGQIVVDGMFVDPRVAQVTAAQRIPAGQVAVTVSLDAVRAVGGLLVPGDKVNIIVGSANGEQRFLYQNVNILFIGTTAAPEAGETQAVETPAAEQGGLITFAVPPEAAQRIVLASQGGGLYLTLVPPDNQPVAVPPVNPGNLFTGVGLTPYEG